MNSLRKKIELCCSCKNVLALIESDILLQRKVRRAEARHTDKNTINLQNKLLH